MSNILFGGQIIPPETDPGEYIVDINDLFDKRIREEEEAYQKREQERLRQERARRVAEAREAMENAEPEYDEDGNLIPPQANFEELDSSLFEEEDSAAAERANAAAEELLNDAREEAEAILERARNEAESIIEEARLDAETQRIMGREKGYAEGYNDGGVKANQELETQKIKIQEELDAVIADYEEKRSNMEIELVDVLCDICAGVFGAQLSGTKDVILHLAENTLHNIEPSNQMQIRVNEDNAAMLREKKQNLLAAVGKEIALDIIVDPVLNNGQCIIETDGGLFDCSVDTELEQLTKQIKALSYYRES